MMTIPKFVAKKAAGEKITMLTAYDYPWAAILDEAGVDGLLVGDSLGMVVQGHENTIPVTLDQMIYHGEMVARAVQNTLVVVDLPFPLSNFGPQAVLEAAARVLKETGCQAVKIEGDESQGEVIRTLVRAGIPVMAHCGLRPQSVLTLGGYKVQRDEESLFRAAKAAETAGAFSVVLECIPETVAADLSRELSIPTIGIGAGAGCDGQILVTHDLMGLTTGRVPRFVKQYADLRDLIGKAVRKYCDEVRSGEFPSDEYSFK